MTTPELIHAIANTLMISLICVTLAVPIGTFLALMLMRTDVFGKSLAWIAIGSQLAIPLYVIAGSWSAGIGLQGWLSAFASPFSELAIKSGVGSLLAVSAVHAAAAIPGVCVISGLGLVWAHRGQEEAALVEGGAWHLFRHSIVPKMRIWTAASCLWCLLPVLTEMVVTNLYQVATVAEQIYLDASRGSISRWTYLAAVLACMLPIAVIGQLLLRRAPPTHQIMGSLTHYSASVIGLRSWRIPLSLIVWAFVFSLVALPIMNLTIKAGWLPYADQSGRTRYGWDLGRFLLTARESLVLYTSEFYWTAVLAISATTLAMTLAGLACFWARGTRARTLVACGMLLLIAVPGPMVGMLTIYVMNRSQPMWLGRLYDTTLAAPIFAQQFRLLPLAWLLLLTIQASISRRTWEQAALDGLSKFAILRRVVIPQTWSRCLAATVLIAITSAGELSSSILVLPPGVTTISMRLFEMLHFGMRHQDSGLCGMLMLLGWSVALLFWKTLRER